MRSVLSKKKLPFLLPGQPIKGRRMGQGLAPCGGAAAHRHRALGGFNHASEVGGNNMANDDSRAPDCKDLVDCDCNKLSPSCGSLVDHIRRRRMVAVTGASGMYWRFGRPGRKTRLAIASLTIAIGLAPSLASAQWSYYQGNDTTIGPFSSGTQVFFDNAALNAFTANTVSGDSTQIFNMFSALNASAATAVNGGIQVFYWSSALNATAAYAVSGGSQNFYDTSTLNASAANAISGGTQTFFGTNALNASAANAVSGGTQIFYTTSGLYAFAANAVSGGIQTFYYTSMLHVGANNALTNTADIRFDKVYGGPGGTLALNGFSTVVGALSSLTSGSGIIQNGWVLDSFLTIDTSLLGNSTFSGLIRDGGAGRLGLIKTGTGSFTLAGINTYTGPTTILGGNLVVSGSLASSPVTVGADAILSGNGTVGGITALAGGIVAPGNSIGTLHVAGDVGFGPGSFYNLDINDAGHSDSIAATGAANLTGGTVRILPDQGRYALTPYTILTAAGGVDGTFAGAAMGPGFAFVIPTLDYTDDAVTLTLRLSSLSPAFHSVAISANQYRTADAVQALGAGNRLYDTVLGASADGARQAFDALSGEAHASAVTTAFADTQRVGDTILQHLWDERALRGPRGLTFWGQGFGAWGRAGSNGNAAGLGTSTGGFIIGADAGLSDAYRLGLAGGFVSTTFDIDGRQSSGTTDTVFGSVYGAAQWNALNVRLGAVFAAHDVHVKRAISLPGFSDRTSASYDGSTLMAFGEIGYAFALGRATVEPFVGASVMRLRMDGFREEGGSAALIGFGKDHDLGTTTLGLRAQAQLGDALPLTLKGLLGWRHAVGDVDPAALLAFAGSATPFAVSGVPVDRNALVAEVGLDWTISPDMTLGVSYTGQVGSRAQDHALKGKFSWQF